ncbi:MAG: hypothetical protein H6974_12980 [Gammaproteobacteria bacterium]|nr:hypothetical protein [Gammaproteobacteria bacterium]
MSPLVRATAIHNAIRDYYLAQPGRTEDGWRAVTSDPGKFNRVWRRALRRCEPSLTLSQDPPPEDLRLIDPATGEWLGEELGEKEAA